MPFPRQSLPILPAHRLDFSFDPRRPRFTAMAFKTSALYLPCRRRHPGRLRQFLRRGRCAPPALPNAIPPRNNAWRRSNPKSATKTAGNGHPGRTTQRRSRPPARRTDAELHSAKPPKTPERPLQRPSTCVWASWKAAVKPPANQRRRACRPAADNAKPAAKAPTPRPTKPTKLANLRPGIDPVAQPRVSQSHLAAENLPDKYPGASQLGDVQYWLAWPTPLITSANRR